MGQVNILERKNPWTDKDVEAHWDQVSHRYVAENIKVKKAHDQRFIETIKHLDLKQNAKVLNISSRDCEANDYIIKVNSTANVINAEISAGLIQEAKKIRPNIKQVKLNTYSKLPFQNKQFNRIICLETLEHVAQPVNLLRELYRISTDDVRMVLTCPPLTSEPTYRIFTFLFGGHGEGPHRFLRSKEVKKLLVYTNWKLILHKGTVLIPVGPKIIQDFGEWIINKLQRTFISELGIRQFYICEKK